MKYTVVVSLLTFSLLPYDFCSRANETDKMLLLEIKNMIIDDPLRIMDSWNETKHFCDWPGVSCGLRHRRVTVLDLSSLKLSGFLSPSISTLSFLRVLKLKNNSFPGEIPSELLYLARMVGKILDELCQLPSLKYLVVKENNLSGSLPPCLFNQLSMVAIDVGTNHIEGNLPSLLGITLPNLSKRTGPWKAVEHMEILVDFNHLGKGEDDDLSFVNTFVNYTCLELLELNTNNFGGALPPSVGYLSYELIEFSLTNNHISGEIPRGISNLKKLAAFFVAYNRFHGEILSENGDMTYLQELALLGNQFSSQIPISFGNLASLTRISFRENNLKGRIPSSLSKCHNLELLQGTCVKLEALELNSNNFQGSIPSTMRNLQGLELLVLSHNNLLGGIPGFLKDFKFLQILNLSSNNPEASLVMLLLSPSLEIKSSVGVYRVGPSGLQCRN
ncbi:putative receptor-like protein kinase At3g47110 [Lycium barbarum]|uniref:putative receptor-like protein kinase At3g47110 n=1 Tax=Lycium barbarum TaxID=112863 RepID=UPI00293E7F16|nr:putative receptor-like protein kinase At3g47110 [Lycium barbarum]